MRTFTASLSLAVLSAVSLPVLSSPSSLTVISFGGATKAAQQTAYFQPFEQSGAAKVVAG